LGGYNTSWPQTGYDAIYGNHYFETVNLPAGTTQYVQGFGKVESVPAGIASSDAKVTNPKDGWLGIHANNITVSGYITASGRGYGGGGGSGSSYNGGPLAQSGFGGANGLGGDGGDAGDDVHYSGGGGGGEFTIGGGGGSNIDGGDAIGAGGGGGGNATQSAGGGGAAGGGYLRLIAYKNLTINSSSRLLANGAGGGGGANDDGSAIIGGGGGKGAGSRELKITFFSFIKDVPFFQVLTEMNKENRIYPAGEFLIN